LGPGAEHMRRREFLGVLGVAATAWPLAARAQQAGRARRIGVLMANPVTDARYQSLVAVFRQRLLELGWDERSNIQIDYRWAAEDAESIRAYARELVGLRPDVILARSSPEIAALRDETHTIPIVFAHATDPVASGFVANLAHPGGNITGFMNFEYPMGGKWLEMLKEVAPRVMRVAVINNPDNVSSPGYLRVIETVAQSLGVQLTNAPVRHFSEIERIIDDFAREPNGGMIAFRATLIVMRTLRQSAGYVLARPAGHSTCAHAWRTPSWQGKSPRRPAPKPNLHPFWHISFIRCPDL
jgi:putative ABC transport system substrate-binding protein